MKEIHNILRAFQRQSGRSFALATLVHTSGSSYRRPGARMLIGSDGSRTGSLSGGCIEDDVALRARDVLQTGQPALLHFDTRRRYGCHGEIHIFIERIAEKFMFDLDECLEARRPCLAVTNLDAPQGDVGSRIMEVPFVGSAGFEWPASFAQEIHPAVRLLIFGDGPDSTPLRSLCELLGWQTIDVPDANLLTFEPDEWTVAVVKTHNYGRDFTALQKLLPLQLPYVGLIGPRKRRDQLLGNLRDIGLTVNAGFFSPAGLDLGGETPEEIALAIVAEIQRELAGALGQSLRERKAPIHAVQKPATALLPVQ